VNVTVEPAGASRVAGVQEGAAARCVAPGRAITLSDTWGQGERAHSRRSVRRGRWLPGWLRPFRTGCSGGPARRYPGRSTSCGGGTGNFPGYHSTVCDARKAARTPEETAISVSGLIHRENAALAG